MRSALLAILGVAMILVTLRDIVHELFHPEATGSMSRQLMHVVWRIVRWIGIRHRPALYHAGPVMLVAVAGMWTLLLSVGWALIYWPHLPTSYHYDPTLPPAATHGFATSLYISFASLSTLGASDITAQVNALRFASTMESFIGLVMFTAWITWVLSIYPVIAERRAFSLEVAMLRRAQENVEAAVTEAPSAAVTDVLRSLTEQVLRVHTQLGQTRVSYYFQNQSPSATLARQIPWVLDLANAAQADGREPAIRHHGVLLYGAVDQLLSEIGAQYLDLQDAPLDKILEGLAEDHLLRESDFEEEEKKSDRGV